MNTFSKMKPNRRQNSGRGGNASSASPPSEHSAAAAVSRAWTGLFWTKLAIALFILAYIIIRIVKIPLTNDEWGTLVSAYRYRIVDLITLYKLSSPVQHHFLTALLAMLCLRLPIDEVVGIRLPGILATIIYLFAALRISDLIRGKWLSLLAFVALLANAFVLDFFGLSRGYGLAMGCMALSLNSLFRSSFRPDSQRDRDYGGAGSVGGNCVCTIHSRIAIWSAFAAVLSNLAFLNYFGAVCIILFLASIKSRPGAESLRRHLLKILFANVYLIYSAILLITFYFPRIIICDEAGYFIFGGSSGFLTDTVKSVVADTLYDLSISQDAVLAIGGLIVALSLAIAFKTIALDAKRDWRVGLRTPAGISSAILIIIFLYSVCMFILFKALYPLDRAAIGLTAIFVCQVAFMADQLSSKWLSAALTLFLAIYTAIGVMNLNLTHTLTWKMTSDIPEMLKKMDDLHRRNRKEMVLGISDDCKYTTWYYAECLLGLKEDERTKKSYGFVKIYDWLTVYSVTYGIPAGAQLNLAPDTDCLMIYRPHEQKSYPFRLELVADYPVSECRLYKVIKPVTPP